MGSVRVRDAIRAIRSFVMLVHPDVRVNVVHRDEPDNRILECAVAATADVIVTDDLHLRQLRRFRGILIASPREFLDSQPRRQL